MSNKIFFWTKWGGATMLLSVFLLSAASTIAQPLRAVDCDQLKVVIVPKAFDGDNDQATCADCCSPKYSCEQMEYLVYLEAVPGVNLPGSGNFNLSYEALYIVLKLDRVNGVVSSINEALTEFCLGDDLTYPDTIPDASFESNADEDEVTLHISSADGDATPPISFSNFVSDNYLFSVVVDAFPGDEFGIGCADFTYISGNDTCTNQTCTGGDPEEFPLPDSTNTSLTLSLDDINCNAEEYVDLPILISSSLSGTISSLDFAVVVTTDAPDGFYAAPEVVDTLAGTSPTITVMAVPGSPGQYVVRFRYVIQSSAPFSGSNIQIALLRIYRPPNLCQGYTIGANLLAGRIRSVAPGPISGIVCRAVQLGGNTSEECEVAGMPVCSDDFNFNLSTEEDPGDCTTLKVYATLSWDPADFSGADTLPFKQLRAILNFDMDSEVSILDAVPEGFSCPSSGNDPVACPDCIMHGGNTVELCINVTTPILVANEARIVVTFDAPSGCIRGATVRKMTLARPDSSVCQPNVDSITVFPYCSPMMENFIQGDIATEQGCWIEDVKVNIVAIETSCNRTVPAGIDGAGNAICEPYTSGCLCDISTAGNYTVTPTKGDNRLNGVTTYDLVLISKHTIGIEPLSTPYKIIAADANKSNSITTFDIVEIRKVILGLDTLPGNASWRFVRESFEFPNPSNPFHTLFPETDTISALPDTLVDFIGIKVGDVNNTAVTECALTPVNECHAFERPSGMFTLREPRRNKIKSGDFYTLPMQASGETSMVALQAAFRFDPQVLELVGPSLGDIPGLSEGNFNLTQVNEGIIRTSWFAQPDALEEEALRPGQSLFNLTFRVKQDLPESTPVLSIDESLMPNLAWTEEGTTYSLQTVASTQREEGNRPETPVWVRCHPNPSPGEVVFDILALPQPRRARLTVFDAFGRSIWHRDLTKETGPVQINLPEAASWPNGVYHWELRFDKQKSVGTFVRQ